MNMTRIRLDRIASSTRNAKLSQEVTLGGSLVCEEGHILAVQILNDKYVYNTVEDVTGRMVKLCAGDVLAGVLGSRRALRGYAGVVPETLQVGDRINVLNLGGVLGHCTSGNPEIGPPYEGEVLGAVLTFPDIGDRVGVPANIHQGTVLRTEKLDAVPPVVYVAGTCMNSGKTLAASEIIRHLSKKGLRIAACKLTGVSLMRDILGMLDAGACDAVSFNDVGVATTRHVDILPVAKGILDHLGKTKPDLIVAELGDGILGEYGVDALLADRELMDAGCCHVVCAPDPVAIFGAKSVYADRFGLPIHVVSGPVTDNSVGRDYILQNLGLAAHNARHDIEGLATVVEQAYQAGRKS